MSRVATEINFLFTKSFKDSTYCIYLPDDITDWTKQNAKKYPLHEL